MYIVFKKNEFVKPNRKDSEFSFLRNCYISNLNLKLSVSGVSLIY